MDAGGGAVVDTIGVVNVCDAVLNTDALGGVQQVDVVGGGAVSLGTIGVLVVDARGAAVLDTTISTTGIGGAVNIQGVAVEQQAFVVNHISTPLH